MEWFNALIESLTTPYCIFKYGGVEECQFHLKSIFVGAAIALPLFGVIGYFKSRNKKKGNKDD